MFASTSTYKLAKMVLSAWPMFWLLEAGQTIRDSCSIAIKPNPYFVCSVQCLPMNYYGCSSCDRICLLMDNVFLECLGGVL